MGRLLWVVMIMNAIWMNAAFSQTRRSVTTPPTNHSAGKIQYGTASYYADKFIGRNTANGEVFSQKKMTGASNVLSLNTWVRVTNLRNKKSVVVKITDRMQHKNKRLIDLSKAAARVLDYLSRGLTRVKVEVLGKKNKE